ncbi:hypothetical protein [Kordia sp.]|uniref:hypothetical protein n=1 Tax=Kordia sp. TaxID=1965332 RepID=UPI003B590877
MKKILLLLVLAFTFFSCDDGDLTLEEIDLTTTADVDACTIQSGVTLLFKINASESLILEAPADLIINEVTEDEESVRTKTLNSQAFCYYRSFESNITTGYFCDELPSDIGITLEYTAVSGTVEVTTTEALEGTVLTGYDHLIILKDVVFTGTNGQDVRYAEFEYGMVTTPLE